MHRAWLGGLHPQSHPHPRHHSVHELHVSTAHTAPLTSALKERYSRYYYYYYHHHYPCHSPSLPPQGDAGQGNADDQHLRRLDARVLCAQQAVPGAATGVHRVPAAPVHIPAHTDQLPVVAGARLSAITSTRIYTLYIVCMSACLYIVCLSVCMSVYAGGLGGGVSQRPGGDLPLLPHRSYLFPPRGALPDPRLRWDLQQ